MFRGEKYFKGALYLGAAFWGMTNTAIASSENRYVIETINHFVRAGDNMTSIANQYSVNRQTVMNYNEFPKRKILTQGQLVVIPIIKLVNNTSTKTTGNIAGNIAGNIGNQFQPKTGSPVASYFPETTRNLTKPTVSPPPALSQPITQTVDLKSDIKKVMSPKYNPTGKDLSLIVPLKEKQFYLGDITLFISKDDILSVPVDEFIRLVSPLINEETIEILKTKAGQNGMVFLSELAVADFIVRYDPGLLELSLSLPVKARQRKGFSIANLDLQSRGNFVQPEAFSAAISARTSFDYIHTGGQKGFADPSIDLNLYGRVKNIAYESEGFYDSRVNKLSRRGSRLIYDNLKHAVRITAGDVRPLTRGYQSSTDTLGLSIARAYSTLQPLRSIRPRGDRSFELTEEAFVEIMINGRAVRRLRLGAGTYDLTDFPFVSGSNDVQVVIETDTGRKEELSFNLFFDQTMLEPGTSEFALTAGVASAISGGSPKYDYDRPIVSGFYRRGLTDTLTLGANIQADEHTGVVGTEAIWSSPLGAIRSQASLSRINDNVDFAAGLDFERNFTRTGQGNQAIQKRSRLGLSFDYTGKNFGRMGSFNPNNRFSLETAANYSWDLSRAMNASIGVDYALGRGLQTDAYGAEARIGWRLLSNIGVNIAVRYDHNDNYDGFGAFLSLSRRFGQNQFIRTSYDTRNDRANLSYTRSGNRHLNDWGFNADLERASEDWALNADLSYLANSADIGLSHRAAMNNNGRITDQRTSLRLASTLGFAGGSFALGRPGNENFAIITPHSSLKGTKIRINPDKDKEYSTSTIFGNAMHTQIGSYSKTTLKYDVDELPIGYDLGDGNFELLAPLHAGYKLVVGSDYSISVLGILVNEYEEPIPFITGTARLISQAKGDVKPIQIFTNRSGRFGEAFKQGTWEIALNTSPKTYFQFTIPKSASGLYRAGTLTPKGDE